MRATTGKKVLVASDCGVSCGSKSNPTQTAGWVESRHEPNGRNGWKAKIRLRCGYSPRITAQRSNSRRRQEQDLSSSRLPHRLSVQGELYKSPRLGRSEPGTVEGVNARGRRKPDHCNNILWQRTGGYQADSPAAVCGPTLATEIERSDSQFPEKTAVFPPDSIVG